MLMTSLLGNEEGFFLYSPEPEDFKLTRILEHRADSKMNSIFPTHPGPVPICGSNPDVEPRVGVLVLPIFTFAFS